MKFISMYTFLFLPDISNFLGHDRNTEKSLAGCVPSIRKLLMVSRSRRDSGARCGSSISGSGERCGSSRSGSGERCGTSNRGGSGSGGSVGSVGQSQCRSDMRSSFLTTQSTTAQHGEQCQ